MGNINLDLTPYFSEPCKISPKVESFRTSNDCTAETPCGLLPCPVCGIAFQRWFVAQTKLFFEGEPDLASVSIVMRNLILPENHLGQVSIKDIARTHRDLLRRAGLGDRKWLGGIDISYNIGLPPAKKRRWSIHATMITSCLTEREKLHLRSYLKKGRSVIRPLKVTPITKFEGAARYAMKENFFSRSTYIKCDGKFGVKDYPLRGAPQTQLMQALLNERHQHRLITIGLRRQGNCLVDVML